MHLCCRTLYYVIDLFDCVLLPPCLTKFNLVSFQLPSTDSASEAHHLLCKWVDGLAFNYGFKGRWMMNWLGEYFPSNYIYMIVRLGLLVGASIAAYTVRQINVRGPKPSNSSLKHTGICGWISITFYSLAVFWSICFVWWSSL